MTRIEERLAHIEQRIEEIYALLLRLVEAQEGESLPDSLPGEKVMPAAQWAAQDDPLEEQFQLALGWAATGRTEDLSDFDLAGRSLRSVDLKDARMARANLARADMTAGRLARADLIEADLSFANLSYAKLEGANLRHARLIRANLNGANLSGADLGGAQVDRAAPRAVADNFA